MNRREFSQLAAGAALMPSLHRGSAQTVPASGRFRFSVMLWTIDNKLPVEHCMEIVAAAGYSGIELVNEFAKWSAEGTRRVRMKMRSLGLIVDAMAGGNVTLADPAGADKLTAQLAAHIAIAKDLDCPRIILTSGNRVDGLSREAQHAACIENLKRLSELAAGSSIELLIEPIDLLENKSAYLNSVTEGFEIVRAVDSPHVKVLYDFYHEQRASGNLIEKLEDNIDLVGLVHIADVPGRHEPGTGEIDYRNIYRKLAELNYSKFIAMEYYPTGDPLTSFKTSRLVALDATRSLAAPYRLT